MKYASKYILYVREKSRQELIFVIRLRIIQNLKYISEHEERKNRHEKCKSNNC